MANLDGLNDPDDLDELDGPSSLSSLALSTCLEELAIFLTNNRQIPDKQQGKAGAEEKEYQAKFI